MTENEIAKIVVDAAIKVHRALGPGLLESVYEIVLAHGLAKRWDEDRATKADQSILRQHSGR